MSTCLSLYRCMRAKSLQSCPTLFNPIDYGPPSSSVHGILQARVLEWIAMPPSRGCSRPRNQTCASYIGRWVLYHWATWEALWTYTQTHAHMCAHTHVFLQESDHTRLSFLKLAFFYLTGSWASFQVDLAYHFNRCMVFQCMNASWFISQSPIAGM